MLGACTTYTAYTCNAMSGHLGYYVNCHIEDTYAAEDSRRMLEELVMDSSELQSYDLVFADNFHVEMQYVLEECKQCDTGEYCPGTGIAYHCPAGTYASTAGLSQSSQCTSCPAGTLIFGI